MSSRPPGSPSRMPPPLDRRHRRRRRRPRRRRHRPGIAAPRPPPSPPPPPPAPALRRPRCGSRLLLAEARVRGVADARGRRSRRGRPSRRRAAGRDHWLIPGWFWPSQATQRLASSDVGRRARRRAAGTVGPGVVVGAGAAADLEDREVQQVADLVVLGQRARLVVEVVEQALEAGVAGRRARARCPSAARASTSTARLGSSMSRRNLREVVGDRVGLLARASSAA